MRRQAICNNDCPKDICHNFEKENDVQKIYASMWKLKFFLKFLLTFYCRKQIKKQ